MSSGAQASPSCSKPTAAAAAERLLCPGDGADREVAASTSSRDRNDPQGRVQATATQVHCQTIQENCCVRNY